MINVNDVWARVTIVTTKLTADDRAQYVDESEDTEANTGCERMRTESKT